LQVLTPSLTLSANSVAPSSKIINRQRSLTVERMRKLHRFLGIPAEVLLV
jgi:antitoxin component HigA of HigAB toxin-antitoxin module